MSGPYFFFPPRRSELLFQAGVLLLILTAGGLALWRASSASSGWPFLFYILIVGLAAWFSLTLGYRMRALQRSAYILDRDGVRLQWGLRIEDVPIDQVIWVGAAEDVEEALPLPLIRWPGSIVGKRRFKDGTPVEFLAAGTKTLVLIATTSNVFAVSPEDRVVFLQSFQRVLEMGSLAPIPPQSITPSFFLFRFWSDRLARTLSLIGGFLSVILLIWVSLVVPGGPDVFLFDRMQGSQGVFPAIQLFLLPAFSTSFFVLDFLLALFLYRRAEFSSRSPDLYKPLAYAMLASGVCIPALFLGAVIFLT
jgi:hypothetical protein